MTAPIASRIMLIRHAEKPADPPPPYGVTPRGRKDPESLRVKGWQRAGALVPFFAPNAGPLQSPLLSTPAVLFAASPGSKGSEDTKSQRPMQTITPLSKRLGLTIHDGFKKGMETQVAAAAMAQAGPVLVCWQHQVAHLIANAILGNATTAPQKWPGDRFDIVWIFDLQPGGGYAFSQLPQMLLSGDLPSVIQAG